MRQGEEASRIHRTAWMPVRLAPAHVINPKLEAALSAVLVIFVRAPFPTSLSGNRALGLPLEAVMEPE